MVGMLVTVHFSDGTSTDTKVWTAGCGANIAGCGSSTGLVPGGGSWTLSVTGNTGSVFDTFNPDTTGNIYWTLTSTAQSGVGQAITSVDLLGGTLGVNGGVLFDRDRTVNSGLQSFGDFGTPGSAGGIDFSTVGHVVPPADSANFVATATYDNIVRFPTSQPCQNFTGATASTGPFAGRTTSPVGCGDEWAKLTFAFNSGPAFVGSGGTNASFHFFQDTDSVLTPEPVTFGLVGAGLVLMAAYRRRKSRLT